MKLKTLLKNISVALPKNNPDIKGIETDSRKIKKGYLFFAIKGFHTDGNLHINEAIKKGAAAVVTENRAMAAKIPIIITKDINDTLSKCSAAFYKNPSAKLNMLGITGTDGKTTVSYFIESIYKTAGKKSGVIGTINHRFGEHLISKAKNTTPLANDINKMLSHFAQKKSDTVIMEVSAHALSQKRVEYISFDAAIFTGLSKDHLDYYKTIPAYFKAKLKLFKMLSRSDSRKIKYAILNGDDVKAKEIIKILSPKIKTVTFGLKSHNNFRAENIRTNFNETSFKLIYPKGSRNIKLKLSGGYNVYNAMAAAAFAYSQKIPMIKIVEGLESLKSIPGRMEKVTAGQNFGVIVDFAHTSKGLLSLLTATKKLRPSKIYSLIGCGGNRDTTKRAPMADIACKNSEFTVITTDNPRDESQKQIFDDMVKGVKGKYKNYKVMRDRKKAIEFILKKAKKNDIVLLTGKGHEDGILVKSKKIPFSDKKTALKILRKIKK